MFNEDIAKLAAKNLGMTIDKDGFLKHRIGDEEEAQKLFNNEYQRLVKNEGLNGRMPRYM